MKKIIAILLLIPIITSVCYGQITFTEGDKTMIANTIVTNEDAADKNVNLILAAYENTGRLFDVKNVTYNLAPGETKLLQTPVMCLTQENSKYKFKGFLWDSFSNQTTPYTSRDSSNITQSDEFILVPFNIGKASGSWLEGSIKSYDGKNSFFAMTGAASVYFDFPSNLTAGQYDVLVYRAINPAPGQPDSLADTKVISAGTERHFEIPFYGMPSGWYEIGNFNFGLRWVL